MNARDPLAEYRRKREFEKTPEPSGEVADAPDVLTRDQGSQIRHFVVQEHHARRLHWDFRLEHEGVLVSWALPRGFPMATDRNRLAVHTEDHPVEYLDFHGDIPAGEYGGGTMKIWDRGTYEAEKFRDREVIVRVHGERVKGRFVLFRTDGKNWMIHRMDGPAEDWDQIPEAGSIEPMRAVPGKLPRDESPWGFEVLWAGMRVMVYAEPGHITVVDDNGEDVTRAFPELGRITRAIGGRFAVLDGELVAFNPQGRPDTERLQRRTGLTADADIKRRSRETPITLILSDLLYRDGRLLIEKPYEERRRLLEEMDLNGESWQTPAYFTDGSALLHASREQGLAGIVAKRLSSSYAERTERQAWRTIANS